MINLLGLIFRKKFTYSVTIGQNPDDVFDFLKNPQSWYRFDFHEILYIQQDDKEMIINTKSGRGIFEKLSADAEKRTIHYTIYHFLEGRWKFELRAKEVSGGSELRFRFTAPVGLPDLIYEQRISNFTIQLDNLKQMMSKSRQKPSGIERSASATLVPVLKYSK